MSPIASWLRDAVAKDLVLSRVHERLEQAAMQDDPVMITGPRGCALERAARAMHYMSSRAEEPFEVLSCADVPEGVCEAELFGFAAGGHGGRPGVLARAGGGTVLLRNVETLPMAAQRALARVLAQRNFVAVGGNETTPLRARIVASSHAESHGLVPARAISADLLGRMATTIRVPGLSENPDDIISLARHFLGISVPGENDRPRSLTPEAEEALRRFSWPGGVDELRACVQEAAARADGDTIQADDLPENIRDARGAATLEVLEVQHIRRALDQAGGNQRRAARALGISRWSLSRRLRKHGLRPDNEAS